MRMCSIASGSSGNCIYVGSDDTHLLVDTGISKKRIEEGLKTLELKGEDLDGILITHEHSDHIQGLGVFSRKYEIPIYATPGTIMGIKSYSGLGKMPEGLYREIRADEPFELGDMTVKPFAISHDANEPSGYRLEQGGKSVAVATDLGKYDSYTVECLRNLDAVLLEANHDIHMLEVGGYPYYLKQRILGDRGHLSNELSGRLLCDILHDPQALAQTERICSSVNVGSTKTGINMDAVRLCGEIVKATAEETKERDSLGCAKLVIFCNAPDDNPFMAGAFLGVTESDAVINVGVSGPGVVKKALEKVRGKGFEELCETIKKTAFKVTRVGQLVAGEASQRLGIPFGIVDLSLAPTPAIGDSVAEILEEIGLERVGAPGTTAALAMLNDQVKKGGVMASSYVGGLSGAFIPVSEDQGMIDAVHAGSLTLEKLEAMTCVCSVGLDMIAIPGHTSAATLSGIIADEMAIGMVNQKTTAVRLIPVIGKDVGDTAEFGGLLGYAPIMPVNEFRCDAFVSRKGRIPAPRCICEQKRKDPGSDSQL